MHCTHEGQTSIDQSAQNNGDPEILHFSFIQYLSFTVNRTLTPKQKDQSEEGTTPRLPLTDFVTTRRVTRTLSVVLLQQSQEVLHFLGDRRFSQGL